METLKELIENLKRLKDLEMHDREVGLYTWSGIDELEQKITDLENLSNNIVMKSDIEQKINQFIFIRNQILRDEKRFKRPMITYDLIRNDYCIRLLQELLED